MTTLMERLRAKDKKGLFNDSFNTISYPTMFLPFDYRNGTRVEVRDLNEKLITTYASIGVVGGSFFTIIGKSGTAKTTYAVQTAYNMVRPFGENAFVLHYDLEQALTYTRIKNITGGTQAELYTKYHLKQEKSYLEDIFDTISAITKEKEENSKDYLYDTKFLNEFGNPIMMYVPTVVILDSIPTLATKDSLDTIEGQTSQMRKSKAITQFYQKLMPIIKTYNITVIAINHINAKIEINAFAKTQPQVMYLKMDESVPKQNHWVR